LQKSAQVLPQFVRGAAARERFFQAKRFHAEGDCLIKEQPMTLATITAANKFAAIIFPSRHIFLSCSMGAAALLVFAVSAAQAQNPSVRSPVPPPREAAAFAAATLSDGTRVPNKPAPPRLQFSDAQMAAIRQAVDRRSDDVDFPLGTAQAAASFKPAPGVAVPATLEGQTLPDELTEKLPALKQYTYVKLPGQAVIVDPMSHKVAEVVPLP
jgi:hypothetical protein